MFKQNISKYKCFYVNLQLYKYFFELIFTRTASNTFRNKNCLQISSSWVSFNFERSGKYAWRHICRCSWGTNGESERQRISWNHLTLNKIVGKVKKVFQKKWKSITQRTIAMLSNNDLIVQLVWIIQKWIFVLFLVFIKMTNLFLPPRKLATYMQN